jgi:hypothetical protein
MWKTYYNTVCTLDLRYLKTWVLVVAKVPAGFFWSLQGSPSLDGPLVCISCTLQWETVGIRQSKTRLKIKLYLLNKSLQSIFLKHTIYSSLFKEMKYNVQPLQMTWDGNTILDTPRQKGSYYQHSPPPMHISMSLKKRSRSSGCIRIKHKLLKNKQNGNFNYTI